MIPRLRSFASAEISHYFPDGISADTPVSTNSKFGDDSWSFYDPNNPRLQRYSASALTISWSSEISGIHESIPYKSIQVVKLYAFFYLNAPNVMVSKKKGSVKNHPATVCSAVNPLLQFLVHLHDKSRLDGGSLPPADSLSDVSVRHLRESLQDWNVKRGNDLRRSLINLSSSAITNACEGFAPRWTSGDIRSLTFPESNPRENYEPVFPNEMFRQVSNRATDDVAGFLRFVGQVPETNSEGLIPEPFLRLKAQGIEVFEDYVELRRGREVGGGYGKGRDAKLNKIAKVGYTNGALLDYLRRVHEACCALIAFYTGARYSDLMGFKQGCLQKIRGAWFLVGTHIKGDDIHKPIEQDLWPAIPALRDAIRCLELFTRFTGNKYLISSLNGVAEDSGKAYSLSGLTANLSRYIRYVDVNHVWSEIVASPHRCRHTLAHQLARADLGLPFIAHQLKHLHSALGAVPQQVTLAYGGIADLKFERATQTPQLHYEMAKSLYDPSSSIAGGGAAEFSQRRKQYFEGKLAVGLSKEDILQELAGQAIPFSSVGMGYCLGRRELKNKDGSTLKPPCMGSLQCAPDMCGNAVITANHAHLWKKVQMQNTEMASRPDMEYAKSALLERAQRASVILLDLGQSQ